MATVKAALFLALGAFAAVFAFHWVVSLVRARQIGDRSGSAKAPTLTQTSIGFVTNFFDTLGIGSFATTTSIYKLLGLVADEKIPGTLNAGHTLPVVAQAFIFIAVISVDVRTLVLMIAVPLAGAWFGAGIVSRWPRRRVQIGMSFALLVAAALMAMAGLGLFPAGGEALGLSGARLAFALAVNTVLGALLTLGIGNYAPCMILVSLLGMDPRAAFPIMMGSAAFLMPIASVRFVRERAYAPQAAFGLTLGGVPAVLIAGLIIKSLPIAAVRWLVVFVVVYTAGAMLRSARRGSPSVEGHLGTVAEPSA